jgi:hypothetical protein
MNTAHCCDAMKTHLDFSCEQHSSPFECPDALVFHSEKFDEYGLIVHNGGEIYVLIQFCPWCGTQMPQSLRNRWFEELEALGFDEPLDQDIPEQYKSGAWHRERRRA